MKLKIGREWTDSCKQLLNSFCILYEGDFYVSETSGTKCMNIQSLYMYYFNDLQETKIYKYTGHWKKVEIRKWSTLSLKESYKRFHENELISMHSF